MNNLQTDKENKNVRGQNLKATKIVIPHPLGKK